MGDADLLRMARDDMKRCESAEVDNRKTAREDIEFARLSKQWPDGIKRQRELEQRPCLTINKLAPVIRQVVNDARQNKPAISIKPVDSKADPETAEILTGLVRSIEHASAADVAYDTGVDQAVSGGFGYWRVDLSYANDLTDEDDLAGLGPEAFEQDICIKRVPNQFAVYGDPDSMAADSADWNVCFVMDKMTHAAFKAKYPKASRSDFDSADWLAYGSNWCSEDEVTVAEYWRREVTKKLIVGVQLADGSPVVMEWEAWQKERPEGSSIIAQPRAVDAYKVTQYLITAVEVLEKTDWLGKFIPIVPVYGDEVIYGGKRYFRSLIADAKDANRMFNYWRTQATELVALAPKAPFIGRRGAFETDLAKWETANTISHPFIEYDGPEQPARQGFSGIPTGVLQEAMNAADDIKAVTGIYDASLGARSNETSGKAIMARQREGDVSTYHFIDNLTRAIRHTGRIIVDLIPKVYTTPRVLRILGEDGKPDMVPVNQEPGEDVARIFDLRVGRYDVVVTAGPSFTSRREEAATQMIELVRAFPDAAPVIGDLLAKNLDWPGADEIARRLEAMLPPHLREEGQGGLPPEVMQQVQQMSEAIDVLRQRLTEAEGKYTLEAKKLAIEEYKAETERFQVVAPAMGPGEVQAIVMQTLRDLATSDALPAGEGAMGPSGMLPQPDLVPA